MDIRFPPVMLGNFSACFIQKEKRERGGEAVSKAMLGDSPSLEDKIIKGMTKGILHCTTNMHSGRDCFHEKMPACQVRFHIFFIFLY